MKVQALLVIALSVAAIATPDQAIKNGYFPGRSADMIIKRRNMAQLDKSAIFVPHNKFINSWPAGASLEEKSVADLVSAVVGGPVINKDTQRGDFPNLNIFNKASANVLIMVDGLSSEDASKLSAVKKDGSLLPLTKSSYPQDIISTCASMSTGHTPSEHGIVNKEWFSNNKLYKAYLKDAHPLVASFGDILSSYFNDKVSVLSASMDTQLASSFGMNNNNNINNNVYSWDSKMEMFTDSHNDESNIRLSFSNLVSKISNREFPEKSDIDIDTLILNIGNTKFSLYNNDHFRFFAELESIRNIIEYHSLNNNIKDISIYNILISSFKRMKNIGSPSQISMSIRIIDQFINDINILLTDRYNDNVAFEYIFMGDNIIDILLKDHETMMMSYNAINSIVDSYDTFDRLYPMIHIVNKLNLNSINCNDLQKKIYREYQVVCPSLDSLYNNYNRRSVLLLRADNNSSMSTSSMDTPSTSPSPPYNPPSTTTSDDVTYFHILLWFNILLFFVALFAIYGLVYMDAGSDSLLYRMTSTSRR